MLVLIVGMVTRIQADELDFLRVPTLGGKVIWSDYVIHHEWRIQRQMTLGHYRLLDDHNRIVTQGSIDKCYRELVCRRQAGDVDPMPPHVVIVMHGLAGSRHWMSGLAKYLEEEGGYTVLNFGFASTQGTIQEHTLALESVLRNLCGVHEVSLVGHSMSNIMLRHLLYRMHHQSLPPPVAIRRMVMISPPNHGAVLADSLGQRAFVQFLLGEPVDQFAPTQEWFCLERELGIPDFEFGIIAGGKFDEHGYLNSIPGDDDGIVGLSSHYLPGAKDFIQVGGRHQIMPLYTRTKRATLHFLKHGHF